MMEASNYAAQSRCCNGGCLNKVLDLTLPSCSRNACPCAAAVASGDGVPADRHGTLGSIQGYPHIAAGDVDLGLLASAYPRVGDDVC